MSISTYFNDEGEPKPEGLLLMNFVKTATDQEIIDALVKKAEAGDPRAARTLVYIHHDVHRDDDYSSIEVCTTEGPAAEVVQIDHKFGKDCLVDPKECFKWAKVASETGTSWDTFRFFSFYEKGYGCQKDLRLALECLLVAIAKEDGSISDIKDVLPYILYIIKDNPGFAGQIRAGLTITVGGKQPGLTDDKAEDYRPC